MVVALLLFPVAASVTANEEAGDLTDTEDGVRLEWSLNVSAGTEVGALVLSIVVVWRFRQVPPPISAIGENAAAQLIGRTSTVVRALPRPIVQLLIRRFVSYLFVLSRRESICF